MKELGCNFTGCRKVVLKHVPVDFGVVLAFCVEHGVQFIKTGGFEHMAKFGFTGEVEVHPSREDA